MRPTEIDVNGHVNNSKYVEYLEWGREEWYEQNGFPYEKLLSLGAITVAVNLNLNYRRECRQGERLRVITRAVRSGKTSFVVSQDILKDSGEVAADAIVTLVTIDPGLRKSRPLPEEFAANFDDASAGRLGSSALKWFENGVDIGIARFEDPATIDDVRLNS